jgi:hypothetical protein
MRTTAVMRATAETKMTMTEELNKNKAPQVLI